MAIFDNFPYTNFHELNTDWIISVVKTVDQSQKEIDAKIQAETDRATAKENEIETKVDNLAKLEADDILAVNDRINNEITRAQSVEETLLKRIGAEETRAKAAEADNTTAISQEAIQRAADDNALQKKISANTNRLNTIESHVNTVYCGLDVIDINVSDVDYIKMQAGKTVKLNISSLPTVGVVIKAPTETVTEITEARLIVDLYDTGIDGKSFGIEGFTRKCFSATSYTQSKQTYAIYNARYIPAEGWILYKIDILYHA